MESNLGSVIIQVICNHQYERRMTSNDMSHYHITILQAIPQFPRILIVKDVIERLELGLNFLLPQPTV